MCEYVVLHGKKGFCITCMIKLRTSRWREYSELHMWVQSYHKDHCMRDTGGARLGVRDGVRVGVREG